MSRNECALTRIESFPDPERNFKRLLLALFPPVFPLLLYSELFLQTNELGSKAMTRKFLILRVNFFSRSVIQLVNPGIPPGDLNSVRTLLGIE